LPVALPKSSNLKYQRRISPRRKERTLSRRLPPSGIALERALQLQEVTEVANPAGRDLDTLLVLYQIYDRRRQALLWFLHELAAKDYPEYRTKYAGTSKERMYFTSVCGFFELAGVLVNRRMLSEDLFFDVFNPTPFWERARPIVEGMEGG
jgi:hypothetical protein